MISLAAAAIPASGPAAPFVGAGLAIGSGIVAAKKLIGKGHKAADKLGKTLTDPFNKVLQRARALQATNPELSRSMTKTAWEQYLSDVDRYASKGSDEAKVVQQNLSTPEFMQTVTGLLGEDPLGSTYAGRFTSKPAGSGGFGSKFLSGLGAILPAVITGGAASMTRTPGFNPNAGYPGAGGVTPPPGSIPGGGQGVPGTQVNSGDSLFRGMLLPTVIGTGANLLSGYLGARAANKAATEQSNASIAAAKLQADAGREASQLQYKSSQEALAFNRDMFGQQQRNMQPWLDAGGGALRQISDLTSPEGWASFKAPDAFKPPDPFVAPTAEKVMASPAVQARLKAGREILDASAARHGRIFGGAYDKELTGYASDLGSQEYDAEYGREVNEYDKNYSRASTNYDRAFNIFQSERAARLNPLMSLAGLGQQSVESINASGSQASGQNAAISGNAATQIGNIGLTTAARVADSNTDAAAARASGYVGSSNSWRDAFGNIANGVMDIATAYRQSRQPRYSYA